MACAASDGHKESRELLFSSKQVMLRPTLLQKKQLLLILVTSETPLATAETELATGHPGM